MKKKSADIVVCITIIGLFIVVGVLCHIDHCGSKRSDLLECLKNERMTKLECQQLFN